MTHLFEVLYVEDVRIVLFVIKEVIDICAIYPPKILTTLDFVDRYVGIRETEIRIDSSQSVTLVESYVFDNSIVAYYFLNPKELKEGVEPRDFLNLLALFYKPPRSPYSKAIAKGIPKHSM